MLYECLFRDLFSVSYNPTILQNMVHYALSRVINSSHLCIICTEVTNFPQVISFLKLLSFQANIDSL